MIKHILFLILFSAFSINLYSQESLNNIGTNKFAPEKKNKTILGNKMCYYESGAGETNFIFLHGNPTSSYLWRNIIPYMEKYGRCIAPDLMGMGDSDKLDESIKDRYTYKSHYMYLNSLLSELQVEKMLY